MRPLDLVVSFASVLTVACSGGGGPTLDGAEVALTPPTHPVSAEGADEQAVAVGEQQTGTGDQRAAGTVEVLLKLELTEFVVSISELTDLGAYEERHPSYDDEMVLVKPWAISVEDVLWINRHVEQESDAELAQLAMGLAM